MGFNGWFRRNQKKVYIVMIFAMSAWGIGSSAMFFIPQKAIGYVYGEKVTRDQLGNFEKRWRKILLSRLQGPVLDLVWKEFVLNREAARSGIVVTDTDVYSGIQELSAQLFGQQANIGTDQLIRLLCNTFGVTRDQLFKTIEEVVNIQKLNYFVKNSVKITTEEALQRYALENEKAKIKYATFNAEDFLDSVEVADNELEEFYNKYKDVYPDKLTKSYGYKEQEKIKLEYIIADYNELKSRVKVSEEEMLKYYEENKETEFIKPVKPEPEKVAANDEPKEDKGPGKIKSKPYEEVKETINIKLQREKAKSLAHEIIVKIDEEVYETLDKINKPSFKELSEKYGIIYKTAKPLGKDTEFITRDALDMLLIGKDRIADMAFERDNFDPSPPMEAIEGEYIFQVIGRKAPETPPLAAISEKVKADLRLEKAFNKAREWAELCAGKMKGSSFKEGLDSFIAEAGGIAPQTGETDYLERPTFQGNRSSGYISALQAYRPNVSLKAFTLKTGEIEVAEEEKGKKACYVITLIDKKGFDMEKFNQDKDQILAQYITQKQRYTSKKWEDNVTKHAELNIKL